MSEGCSLSEDAPGGASKGPRRPQADSVRPNASARALSIAARRMGRSERLTNHSSGAIHTTDRLRQARGGAPPAEILPRVCYFLPSFFNHFVASRRTFAGAVPPWLTRLFTEFST